MTRQFWKEQGLFLHVFIHLLSTPSSTFHCFTRSFAVRRQWHLISRLYTAASERTVPLSHLSASTATGVASLYTSIPNVAMGMRSLWRPSNWEARSANFRPHRTWHHHMAAGSYWLCEKRLSHCFEGGGWEPIIICMFYTTLVSDRMFSLIGAYPTVVSNCGSLSVLARDHWLCWFA